MVEVEMVEMGTAESGLMDLGMVEVRLTMSDGGGGVAYK